MLFITFEPYDNENNIEVVECFICYENKLNEELFNLNTQIYYLKQCNCVGYLHKNCLDIWYNMNRKCPVCRKKIIKNILIPFVCNKPLNYYLYKRIKAFLSLFTIIVVIWTINDYYVTFINVYNVFTNYPMNYN